MISWIQNHLIRHGRWIFLTLLALIIVAFVFTIGNTPGCTSDSSAYEPQEFYGVDLNAVRERQPIIDKASLSLFLNGQQNRNEQQFQSEVMSRVAMLHLADELSIPAPDKAALAAYAKTKAAFRGSDGTFSVDVYTTFLDTLDANPNMRKELVAQVLEDDYRIDQIGSVVSGPGYILPSEVLAQAQSSQSVLTVATAEISYQDFTPEIVPTPEVLTAFFEENQLRYEIPERIQASYLSFPTPKVAVTELPEADLRDHFIANRQRFVEAYLAQQPAPEGEAAAPSVTFADVREAVATELAGEAALRAANEAAQAFAYTLYSQEIKRDSAAFNKLVNESGLSLIAIVPYALENTAQRALNPQMLAAAFALNKTRYYSDAYRAADGYALLIYQDRIAPELPAYETVAAAVQTDYLAEQKRALFNERGASLQAELKAQLAAGTAFADAAAALNLGANSFEPFKSAEAPQELNRSVLQTAQRMRAGEVSAMLNLQGIGTFVYLKDKNTPEIASDSDDYTQAENFLRYVAGSVSAGALVNELVARGLPEPAEIQE
ncbi:MAG: peptidyl-prolyl cis-trans isomerase D [Lentimonas sp.]|jgi:peptidyl-prolyl cis-trans isomerase D